MVQKILPADFERGPTQGRTIVGETTEALHKFLLEGWTLGGAAPRIEEDLSFVPKDREEVAYVYMYTASLGYELQIASVTAIVLMVPGAVLLVLLERFLKSEYLVFFGQL